MSNYPPTPPSPYSSPGYSMPPGYSPVPLMTTAARRAGMLLIVIGALMVLGCGFFGVFGVMLPRMTLPAETAEQFHQLEAKSGQPLSAIAMVVMIMGGAGVVIGIYQIVAGVFVRLGGRGSAIFAIVSTALLMLFLLLMSLSNVISGDPSQMGSGVCMLVVGGALLLWQMLWLIAALRESLNRGQMAAAYQAQYWQYQQQQQAYQQPYPPGYGYPPPPPGAANSGWAYGAPPPPPPSAPPEEPKQHYPTGDK